MEYSDYTVEDFALDKKFRKWILEEDVALNNFWAEWIKKYPHKINTLKEARKIVLTLPDVQHNISQERIDEIWEHVQGVMDQKSFEKKEGRLVPFNASSLLLSEKSPRNRRREYGIYWRVAAIFVFALGISYLTFQFTDRTPPPEKTIAEQWIIKSTAWGQKMRFFLSDGSEVVLNAGSTLKYQKYFEKDKRELTLSGEAYFKVAEDGERPFTVKTAYLETTALGTEFNVKAYDQQSASIALAEGKVEVIALLNDNSQKERFLLTPGEGVKYGHNNTPAQFNFDKKAFLLWKDGVLYFQKAKEKEVFGKLEQWYGVKIISENTSSKTWGFSGEFHNKSLETVMTSLGFAMDFTFELANDSVNVKYN